MTFGNMGGTAVTSVAPGFIDPGATQLFSPNQQAYLLGLETEIGNLRTKVDLLIDALQLYGLILWAKLVNMFTLKINNVKK